jgi:predicted Ser/Thr protein kinase
MTSQRHEEIKKLFLSVCELDEAGRASFLDQACRDDPELRSEVESLLRHHLPDTIIEAPVPARQSGGHADGGAPQVLAEPVAPDLTPVPVAEPQPRFSAGTIIGQRYRIVGLLGRGGMGEVYRADDLKLQRTVALKFLAHDRVSDPAWLARFQNEVRLSLKITHPNICRVYDIGEAEGEVFISMEYIDGENLASLLRRIGRLPPEKAVQIIRQICFGLAAAHARGILHRDLKPANIMLDSRGDVRITDFGIAVLAEPASQGATLIGTPAYMAPEVLAGEPSSVASDIFGLGLLMYEIVTGKEAFGGGGLLQRAKRPPVIPPSRWVENLDPAFERLILQCLQENPRERPASVYQVLAGIPGTDPLGAALAAGELPSPTLVAAARTGAARPTLVLASFGSGLLGLALVVVLANRTFLLPQAGLTRAPAVLEDKAEDAIRRLEGTQEVRGRSNGFFVEPNCLEWFRGGADRSRSWRSVFSDPQRSPVYFEYQTGENVAHPRGPLQRPGVSRFTPPPAGATTIRLNPAGQLQAFSEVLDRPVLESPSRQPPDWRSAFELAGLRMSDFQSAPPVRQPPLFADGNLAWTEVRPADSSAPLWVEGAALHERIVFFDLVRPWEQEPHRAGIADAVARGQVIASQARYLLFLVSLAGGLLLARRNLRLGRGDRRGAWQLAAFMLCLEIVQWIVQTQHTADLLMEAHSLIGGLRYAVFEAVIIWCFYIALEPYVRQFWPHSIISWSRLLVGQARDPLIGRDVVIGVAIGIGIVLLQQVTVLLPSLTGLPPVPLLPAGGYELGTLAGTGFKLHVLIGSLQTAVLVGLVLALLMLLLRVVLRIPWIAGFAFLVTTTALSVVAFQTTMAFSWIAGAIIAIGMALTLVRVGLLATIASLFATYLLISLPMTSDFYSWYGGSAAFGLLALAALLSLGLYLSLPGKSRPGPDVPVM